MNIISIVVILCIILIPAILVAALITNLNRNQWHRVQEMQRKDSVFVRGFRQLREAEAIIISKSETIVENAGGYAKVDLIVEIKLTGNASFQVSTCWLVKVDSLNQVLPGNKVPVKVDPKNNSRILPDVPWAKPWIFG